MEVTIGNVPREGGAGASLRRRRLIFSGLVIASCAALLWLMAETLFAAGPDWEGAVMLMLFAVTLPWTTIGFWNAVIGFSLMTVVRDARRLVAPHMRSTAGEEEIASSTALLICIRNEDTRRLQRNLTWMLDGLAATRHSNWFHLYIASDSSDPAIAAAEQQAADALTQR